MPDTSPLDADLLRFIDDAVDAVETIEVLILLVAGDRAWLDAGQVASALQTSERSAARRLAHLAVVGLASTRGPFYRYTPASATQAALVDKLLRTYRTHRLRVIDAVFNRPHGSR